jgi:histidinol dehydrogenase
MTTLRFRGRFADMTETDRRALFDRSTSADPAIVRTVGEIIGDVRNRGDAALLDLARRFDPAVPSCLEVDAREMRRALDAIDPALRRAMERGARNIAAVHRAALPQPVCVEPEPGVSVMRRPDALSRVGIYAPGGRAAYPSSVLMAAVPARVAGVAEVLLCSPPAETGLPSDAVLAAAALSGVDRVFAIGGAGAVAAMAFGTETVPRVDRIVGPGNAWVAEAKLQVVGATAIDAPAGPSELLVIGDQDASAESIAIEMLAQAEHDPAAWVVALCIGDRLAAGVEGEIELLATSQPRADVVRAALARQGGVIVVESLDEAIRFANSFAPEHLLLAGGASSAVDRVRGAGTVFVGETSSVVFGDYITGANHVLPTGGLARAYSGLSVGDFLRWTTVQRIDRAAAASLAQDTVDFATAERLGGHAAAAARWRAQ